MRNEKYLQVGVEKVQQRHLEAKVAVLQHLRRLLEGLTQQLHQRVGRQDTHRGHQVDQG